MVRCDVPVIPPTAVTITITITITSKDDVWCGNRLKIHSWLLEILSHLILMFKSRLNPILAP